MWSRTRKLMEDRLANCLKKRVSYTYDVFETNHCKYWTTMYVFNIKVDKEKWFCTNPNFYNASYDEM